ncbi:hypothetical protein CKO28_03595 [Rhodovibrio sodomensis]|uniref:YjiS-like domain-containing protein n=1 Tax=Rhodovibrio sodomensis TaxID=1088 RepID=A0ABS1DC26_9PROT|nr:hypothetical protein [Rhodovibrio sodomensis]MBK1667128.1 hypothetical protein [Rhodovibrio sodomensis]
MNLLTARAGADLRQVHSRSFRATVSAAAARAAAVGPFAGLTRRFAELRTAAALRRELESLGDTALADLGLSRAGIGAHVRRVMANRRRPGRAQSPAALSAHLLRDVAVQLEQGRARVYTDVPLGVITRAPAAGLPANGERFRRTA